MKPTHIVIHHSATSTEVTFEQIRDHHLARGWSDIGYHYVVTASGEIIAGRDEDCVGAHAMGINQTSVGICCIGNFEEIHPTAEQFQALMQLAGEITARWNIEVNNIIGHCDVTCEERGFKKSLCPGKNLYSRIGEIRQAASRG